jgi:hypothetical protein
MSSLDRSLPHRTQPELAPPRERPRRRPTDPRVEVERIDTEQLSVDQHRDAAAALAVLIDRWTRLSENSANEANPTAPPDAIASRPSRGLTPSSDRPHS